jgi:competence protein ComEC
MSALGLALILCIGALMSARRAGLAWALTLCPALILAGNAAYRLHRNRLCEWESLPPREARLVLRCDRVFASSSSTRCSGLATIQDAAPHLRDLRGQRIYFSLPLGSGQDCPLRSSIVSAVGQLETLPLQPEAHSFDQYLADAGINFRFSRGRLLSVVKDPAPYYLFCAAALKKMGTVLGAGIDESRPSLAGVYRAMLLGQQNEMNAEQNQVYRQTGTMHLFAISGLHITVIAAALHGVLGLFRLPSVPKYLLCILLLWLYVDITGAAPSAVRAFVMVALVETALLLRRPINPLATLSAATVAVMVFSPLQIFGASYQMSYGIVAILILMAGPLCEELQNRWLPYRDVPRVALPRTHAFIQFVWRASMIAFASGLCASLVGLVTGVTFFGMLTPGSLAVNLILIPVSTYVLIAGFCSLLAGGLWFTGACVIFNNAGALVLLFMEKTARISASLPGMFYQRDFVWQWIGGGSLIVVLLCCIVGYSTRWTWRLGGYWIPIVVTAVALLATSQRP